MKLTHLILVLVLFTIAGCKKSETITDDSSSRGGNSTLGLTRGLVAYYPFSGNANDASGNGYNGIVSGATLTSDRFNKSGKAYYFNGESTTKIQTTFPGILGDNSRSISVWVKRSANLYNHTSILTWGTYAGGQLNDLLMSGIGGHYFAFDNGGSYVGNNYPSIIDNNWHHYLVVFDRNLGQSVLVSKIYIDGLPVANDVSYNPQFVNTIEGQKMIIGQYDPVNDPRTFLGSLDDIRVYNRVLNQQEITYLATH